MKETLKNYLDDFSVLPGAVKTVIYLVILALLAVCVWQSVSNYFSNKEIERLEAENKIFAETAAKWQSSAEHFAKQAADEKLRGDNLESQIPKIESQIKTSDEKLQTVSEKSNSIRGDLDGVRNSQPTGASASELQRKLEDRYGQSKPR